MWFLHCNIARAPDSRYCCSAKCDQKTRAETSYRNSSKRKQKPPSKHQKANEMYFILNDQTQHTIHEWVNAVVNQLNHSDRFALPLEQDGPWAAWISSRFMCNLATAPSLGRCGSKPKPSPSAEPCWHGGSKPWEMGDVSGPTCPCTSTEVLQHTSMEVGSCTLFYNMSEQKWVDLKPVNF